MGFVVIKNYQIKRNVVTNVVNLTIDPNYIMYVVGMRIDKGEFTKCYDQNNRLLCTVDIDGLKSIQQNITLNSITNYRVYRGAGKQIGVSSVNPSYIKTYREITLKDERGGKTLNFYRLYDSNGNQRFMTDEQGIVSIRNSETYFSITNLKVYKGIITPLEIINVNPYNYIGGFETVNIGKSDVHIAYNPNGGVLFTVDKTDYLVLIGDK